MTVGLVLVKDYPARCPAGTQSPPLGKGGADSGQAPPADWLPPQSGGDVSGPPHQDLAGQLQSSRARRLQEAGDRRRRARQAVGEVQRLRELRIAVADPADGAAVPVEHGAAGVWGDGKAACPVHQRQERVWLFWNRPLVGKASGRAVHYLTSLGRGLSLATGLLSFLQVFWDPNRQAVQDKMVGTVVVDEPIRGFAAEIPPAPLS